MIRYTRCRPDHALILVGDRETVELPTSMGDELVAATGSCIAVGTHSGIECDTLVTLSDESGPSGEPKEGLFIAYSGELQLRSGVLSVETPSGSSLFELCAPQGRLHVVVWVDDELEPSNIWIQATPPR